MIVTLLLTPQSRVPLEKLTGFAANQEIPRILWNPKVHYRIHKRPVLFFILINLATLSKCLPHPLFTPCTVPEIHFRYLSLSPLAMVVVLLPNK